MAKGNKMEAKVSGLVFPLLNSQLYHGSSFAGISYSSLKGNIFSYMWFPRDCMYVIILSPI